MSTRERYEQACDDIRAATGKRNLTQAESLAALGLARPDIRFVAVGDNSGHFQSAVLTTEEKVKALREKSAKERRENEFNELVKKFREEHPDVSDESARHFLKNALEIETRH